jgi:hypothetical protein
MRVAVPGGTEPARIVRFALAADDAALGGEERDALVTGSPDSTRHIECCPHRTAFNS